MEKVEILTVIFAVAAFFLLHRASKIETPGRLRQRRISQTGSTMRPLKPSTVTRALSEATDEQIASEAGKRNSAKRKVRSDGRNGGRPKRSTAPVSQPDIRPGA